MCAGQLRVVVAFSQLRVVVTSCSQLRVAVYGLAAFWIFTISSAIAFAFLAFDTNKSILIFIDSNIIFIYQIISCWAFSADADAGGGRRPIKTTTASATLPQRFRAASADFGWGLIDDDDVVNKIIITGVIIR